MAKAHGDELCMTIPMWFPGKYVQRSGDSQSMLGRLEKLELHVMLAQARCGDLEGYKLGATKIVACARNEVALVGCI